ncbi:MAG: T9SS type A sorting domain-containing protein [Flavobacteriales bacterium]|jgi:hypothetical protein
MKRQLLSILAICISSATIQAQSLTLINPQSMVTGTIADLGASGELVAEWHVQNTSQSNMNVRARRNIISEVDGSLNYFCWGVCFSETVDVSPASVAQAMTAGSINTSFYAHYKPQNNPGETIIQYCFFNNSNPTDETCHTVQYCVDVACILNVDENAPELELSELSPNPLKGLGSLQYNFKNQPNQAKIVIYNMVGQVVQETNINGKNGFILLNGEDFEAGMYLYSIIADGKVMATKRMMVN